MIEVIYNENSEDKKDRVKSPRLPKNIRQIGSTGENFKIYVEDYVVTFLNQLTEKDLSKTRVAILMGETVECGARYLFISGAVYVEEIVIDSGGIHFTDAIWSRIYENIKEYFDSLEIVGWYLSIPGFPIEMNPEITKVHINQFAGNNKVLMMNEPMEGEERFFYYENGTMKSISGYYIYYEKNNAMQTYMIEQRNEQAEEEIIKTEEKVNTATRQFRTIVQEKQEEMHKRKMTSFMYTVSSVLVMIVLIIGITMMNNYDKINNMEKSLAILTKNSIQQAVEPTVTKVLEKQAAETLGNDNESTEAIAVETISGNVQKKEELQPTIAVENVQEAMVQITESIEPTEAPTIQPTDPPTPEPTKTPIPEPTAPPVQQVEESEPASTEPNYYVVKEGDTLAEISIRVYNTKSKISDICEVNGIEDIDKIFVGQKILLP